LSRKRGTALLKRAKRGESADRLLTTIGERIHQSNCKV
jgi:hypothetical protein